MDEEQDQARRPDETPIKFLGRPSGRRVESFRQLIEAENVLASYSHSMDLLAEAVQNALDAIDTRSEREPGAPRRLEIQFDAQRRRFVVTDTGTGLSRDDLEMVLTPNVTLKHGRLAQSRKGRSRGEKGVGLTFLVLACDAFALQTCNGEERWDVTVSDAGRWVRTQGEVATPEGQPRVHEADTKLGSDKYTSVSVSGITADQFDDDLFARGPSELEWDLRTKTAIGNTAGLFESLGRKAPAPVEITVRYRHRDGTEVEPFSVTYGYATPEVLLEQTGASMKVRSFEELGKLSGEELANATRGAALRYIRRFETQTRGVVDMYLLAIDGNEMTNRLLEIEAGGGWTPREWQGMFVATRDMPTGVALRGGVIQPRAWERRLFVLLQYDELKLDLGRKTLAGRTPGMLSELVRKAWDSDLKYLVPRLEPTVAPGRGVALAALQSRIRQARRVPDLQSERVPYLKEPINPGGVAALFHELLPMNGVVPRFRTLASAVFRPSDALVHRPEDDPDTDDPVHVLFAMRPTELVQELETQERTGTVVLGVLWTLVDEQLAKSRIEVHDAAAQQDGATHELVLNGLARRDSIRVIVLEHLVRER